MSHSEPREQRLLQSPFHRRLAALNEANDWSIWKGYTTPQRYDDVEMEYFALRNSAGVFDLCPMLKYRICGPDAEACLNRIMTRDVTKIRPGRVGYSVWCDDAGQVMDDGTLFRLGEDDFRLCAYSHVLDWLCWSALGFDVTVVDETAAVAALSLQGPTSCSILHAMGLPGIEDMKPFDLRRFELDDIALMISRTGFTGDLGYELWLAPDDAEPLWDRLFAAGEHYMIRPVGGLAYDLARIEAGFLQARVDFMPAEETVRPGHSSSPWELGLDWLVDLDKPHFNGRAALLAERKRGVRRRLVVLDVAGNKPATHAFIYAGRKRVGEVSSAAWCPTIKSNLALATVDAAAAGAGNRLRAEIYYQRELRWSRLMADCRVLEGSPFQPARRRQTPATVLHRP